MVPKLIEIKEMQYLQEILNEFYDMADISVELFDEELTGLNPNGRLQLNEYDIDKESILKMDSADNYTPVRLDDNSMILVVPIKACNHKVASIIAGRFTTEEQDFHIKGVPVISNRKFEALGRFILKFSGLLGRMFYEKMIKIEKDRKIADDITERKKIEEELKQSEEKYRRLVEILPDAVYVRTEEKIVFANNAMAKLFGAERPEDLTGKKLQEIAVVDENYNKENRRRNFSKKLLKEKIPLTEQKLHCLLNNRDVYIELTSAYFPMNNKDCWLVACRDISERKYLNETVIEKTRLLNDVLEYDRLKTEFMANISHELRTPINVILSALQMVNININKLSADDETTKVKKYLSMMRQNSYRLIRLINNLIDITKIEGGYYKLNIINCNIVSIIEDITISVAEYAKNKGLDLVFDTDLEEKEIACDPDKIERIILNLLSNAIKFTPFGGSIIVNITENNGFLNITVTDTGIGVPEDKQKQIFDRFVQVDKSLSRSCEGSGIGLSLVKSLVELHGGKISLSSEYGKGSAFVILLPIITADSEDNLKAADYIIGSNVERINVEFSDIYM